jgi:arsenate reductase
MKRIYHLSSCDNCRKLIKAFNPSSDFELVDIKTNSINAQTLDFLKEIVGSYEAIFSKRAIKYKSLGLKDKNLSEDDFRKLILEEYTFLKRPVLIDGDKVVIGSLG